MTIRVNVNDEYYPQIDELFFTAYADEHGMSEVSRQVAFCEVIDFQKLALVIPSVLWPKSWRDAYDHR